MLVTGRHRQRQELHPGRDGQLHQPHHRKPHPHHRGPHRVHPPNDKASISQREIGPDTARLHRGAAGRAAPGPRRHPRRARCATWRPSTSRCKAAETGHLVFSTVHTTDAHEDGQPAHRRLPGRAPEHRAPAAGRKPEGHHQPAAGAHAGRQGARARRGDHAPHRTVEECIKDPMRTFEHQGRHRAGARQLQDPVLRPAPHGTLQGKRHHLRDGPSGRHQSGRLRANGAAGVGGRFPTVSPAVGAGGRQAVD